MMVKEKMRLGQEVLVGSERRLAVVDALTQSFAGVVLAGGSYEMVRYEDLYGKE